MDVIPAIDLRNGRCVRLLKGEFDRETVYSDDPQAVLSDFEKLACSRLHLVDLDGARSGEQQNRALVQRIVADSKLAIQLGGGIRDATVLEGWIEVGIHRAVIGSVAALEPALVTEWLQEFGTDRLVLALDCRCDENGVPWLTTHGWTQATSLCLWDSIEHYAGIGARHFLCTDVSRDGAATGPSLSLYRETLARFPGIALQASGGVRNLDDLESLRDLGAAAAITGRALLDGSLLPGEVKSFQQNA